MGYMSHWSPLLSLTEQCFWSMNWSESTASFFSAWMAACGSIVNIVSSGWSGKFVGLMPWKATNPTRFCSDLKARNISLSLFGLKRIKLRDDFADYLILPLSCLGILAFEGFPLISTFLHCFWHGEYWQFVNAIHLKFSNTKAPNSSKIAWFVDWIWCIFDNPHRFNQDVKLALQ